MVLTDAIVDELRRRLSRQWGEAVWTAPDAAWEVLHHARTLLATGHATLGSRP